MDMALTSTASVFYVAGLLGNNSTLWSPPQTIIQTVPVTASYCSTEHLGVAQNRRTRCLQQGFSLCEDIFSIQASRG
ncbi:hypothetical protein UPYG_G00336220 [Umbra pygmaea]|uniref:Uncharacterized protein n=1 Tax=Umbra pygmaea TaxID=75934 RepID=A0ABD0VW03_UMBPY